MLTTIIIEFDNRPTITTKVDLAKANTHPVILTQRMTSPAYDLYLYPSGNATYVSDTECFDGYWTVPQAREGG